MAKFPLLEQMRADRFNRELSLNKELAANKSALQHLGFRYDDLMVSYRKLEEVLQILAKKPKLVEQAIDQLIYETVQVFRRQLYEQCKGFGSFTTTIDMGMFAGLSNEEILNEIKARFKASKLFASFDRISETITISYVTIPHIDRQIKFAVY